MCRSSRTRDYRQTEDWLIRRIDRQRSYSFAHNPDRTSPAARGFKLFEVVSLRIERNLGLLGLFANWPYRGMQ